MEFGRFRELIDGNPDLLFLHLQGLGEPLLHTSFFDMVEYSAQRGILVGTCTNGHVLSPAILEALPGSSLSYLAISIDGTGDLLGELREGADYALLSANIEAIARVRGRGTMLAFWVVVQQRNITELDRIVGLAEEHGVGHIIFTFVHAAFTTPATGSSLLWAEGQEDLGELRRRLTKRCRKSGIMASFPSTIPRHKLTNCRWPWYACSISVDGDALPCCLIHDKHLFGNVFRESVEHVWNNEEYEKFRRDLKSGALPEYCEKCQYL